MVCAGDMLPGQVQVQCAGGGVTLGSSSCWDTLTRATPAKSRAANPTPPLEPLTLGQEAGLPSWPRPTPPSPSRCRHEHLLPFLASTLKTTNTQE